MTPYYETELGKLYHGDCLQIMPQLEPVDLVLTDPPYGIHNKIARNGSTLSKGSAFGIRYDENPWDKKQPPKEAFLEIFKISKNQIICGGNYFVKHLPISRGWVFWDKMGDGISSVNPELIFTSFDKSIKTFKRCHGLDKGFMQKDSFCGLHPTQKPVALIIWLLNEFSTEKCSILDPFLGSGTTAIACERLKRKWIGIEIEEKYCEIAAKRIEQERKQLKLF